MTQNKIIENENFPQREGLYLVSGFKEKEQEQTLTVFMNRFRALCCDSRDYCEENLGQWSNYDVPVKLTGLEFIQRLGDF